MKPTAVEIRTILVVAAVLGALIFMPDSATSTRWQLERRAREWKQSTISGPTDPSLIAGNIELAGEWVNDHRLSSSSFVFT